MFETFLVYILPCTLYHFAFCVTFCEMMMLLQDDDAMNDEPSNYQNHSNHMLVEQTFCGNLQQHHPCANIVNRMNPSEQVRQIHTDLFDTGDEALPPLMSTHFTKDWSTIAAPLTEQVDAALFNNLHIDRVCRNVMLLCLCVSRV
jgi:hypothetical protein